MGIWLELGIFIVVIAWGFWQLHDVKQAKAKRLADEAQARKHKAPEASDSPLP
jgi:hypothetical protein